MFRLWSPPAGLLATVVYIIGVTEAQSVTCNTSMVSSVIEWATYSFTATTTNWPYLSNHPECRSYMSSLEGSSLEGSSLEGSSLEGYRHPPSTDSSFTSATASNPCTFLTETTDRSLSPETGAAATSKFTSRTLRKTCSKGGRTSTVGQTMSFSSATETFPLYVSPVPPSQPSSSTSSTSISADTTVTVEVLTITETETAFESLSTDFSSIYPYSSTGISYSSAPGSSSTIPATELLGTTSSHAKMCTRRVSKTSTVLSTATSST